MVISKIPFSKRVNNKAFTLIEVLIALMIIAIALGAAIRAVNESARVTIHVRNTMTAHWVGLNVLSEIQTGLMPFPRDNTVLTGETKMFGQAWTWTAQQTRSDKLPTVMRIVVIVQLRSKNITSVTGYM
ncbi:MAG: type II secretion system minor pseudopilin GspI [Gammaproteobacteria bacterium]|nr:type II secretion system minor pseudopilin GspI [Gammaproteobacteria bacterium]